MHIKAKLLMKKFIYKETSCNMHIHAYEKKPGRKFIFRCCNLANLNQFASKDKNVNIHNLVSRVSSVIN